MVTKTANRLTRPSKSSLEHAALTMAVGIVMERLNKLSQQDRDDLYELVKGLASADTCEERESITTAMMEILAQECVQVREMDLDDDSPERGLQTWLDYVSGRIRELRKAAHLTQDDLAAKAGLPQSHISRLEGAKHSPSRVTLEKIAIALEVSVDQFDYSA